MPCELCGGGDMWIKTCRTPEGSRLLVCDECYEENSSILVIVPGDRTVRAMRAILYEFFPDGLYCWVKCASVCILLPRQYPCTCPATTSTPTGVAAAAARNGAPRGVVGRDNGTRRRSLTHLKLNYWISARPLLVSRTSSPITVMFSSRPTTRLMLPGIAPPAR
jgi:hypothetical protein